MELEKFAERKKFLAEKIAYETSIPFTSGPDAPMWDPGKAFQAGVGGLASGVAGGITSAGLRGIGSLIKGVASSLKERLVLNKRREALFDDVVRNDPIVSVFEKEDPGTSIKAYTTLVRAAPTLSLDPNVTTAYLRNAAQTGGAIDFQTIKLLSEAELAMKKARGDIGERR